LLFCGPTLILLPQSPVVPLPFHLMRANGPSAEEVSNREAESVPDELIIDKNRA